MRHSLISVRVLIVLLIAVASSTGQTKYSAPEDAIRAADEGWARVFGAKDLKASVDFCADGASMLPPGAPIATGRQAISQVISGFFALPDLKITWHPTNIEVARSGELGYTSGVYEMSFKDPSGKTMTDRGKYVTVWKKQKSGSWKVIYDIFNSDLPAPAATP